MKLTQKNRLANKSGERSTDVRSVQQSTDRNRL